MLFQQIADTQFMSTDNFFDNQRKASEIKSEIVAKYFSTWVSIIGSSSSNMAYIDLFCGPGKFVEADSTPVIIMKHILSKPSLKNCMHTIFNDEKQEYITDLKNNLNALDGINELKHTPKYSNYTVDDELRERIFKTFTMPSFVFIDPFGYKGITLELLSDSVKNYGCDAMLFFNYKRIFSATKNSLSKIKEHIKGLFGVNDVSELSKYLDEADDKLEAMIGVLTEKLSQKGIKYIIPYRVYTTTKNNTIIPTRYKLSHAFLMITKSEKARSIIKNIYRNASSPENAAKYAYWPYEENTIMKDLDENINDVMADDILSQYAGQEISCGELKEYLAEKPYYADTDVTTTLKGMEASGRLLVNGKHRKGAYPKDLKIQVRK